VLLVLGNSGKDLSKIVKVLVEGLRMGKIRGSWIILNRFWKNSG
jgi:hypothetical protein